MVKRLLESLMLLLAVGVALFTLVDLKDNRGECRDPYEAWGK